MLHFQLAIARFSRVWHASLSARCCSVLEGITIFLHASLSARLLLIIQLATRGRIKKSMSFYKHSIARFSRVWHASLSARYCSVLEGTTCFTFSLLLLGSRGYDMLNFQLAIARFSRVWHASLSARYCSILEGTTCFTFSSLLLGSRGYDMLHFQLAIARFSRVWHASLSARYCSVLEGMIYEESPRSSKGWARQRRLNLSNRSETQIYR